MNIDPTQAPQSNGSHQEILNAGLEHYLNITRGLFPEDGFPLPVNAEETPLAARAFEQAGKDADTYQLIRQRQAIDGAFTQGQLSPEGYTRSTKYNEDLIKIRQAQLQEPKEPS